MRAMTIPHSRIDRLLQESPSLRPVVEQLVAKACADARDWAADETALSETTFPAVCPFTTEQSLTEDFLPEG
jgi:Domain of unknown function DUF29